MTLMMTSLRYLPLMAAMLLGASTTACTSGSGDPPIPLPGSGGVVTGQAYPEGPYGATVGKVVKNFIFPGYQRPRNGLGETFHGEVPLGDFFNPTSEGVFPDDSLYDPGQPLPRALVINVSAVWCGPCKFEAQNTLPDEYEHFKPLGAEIMMVLLDSGKPGEPASFNDLDNWLTSYDSAYPSVIDPENQIGTLIDTSAFPSHFIIDTRDMTIVESIPGSPQDAFWETLETLLAETAQ